MNSNVSFCNLRPGGIALTDRLISCAGLAPGARIADLGCGTSETIGYLLASGYIPIGVDVDKQAISRAKRIYPDVTYYAIDAAELSLPKGMLDGILMECSFSKMRRPDAVLRTCNRLLSPGGVLMMTDLYARGVSSVFTGTLGRIETRDEIIERLARSGMKVCLWEDHTPSLYDWWGQMRMNGHLVLCGGSEERAARKQARCGYYLLLARRV